MPFGTQRGRAKDECVGSTPKCSPNFCLPGAQGRVKDSHIPDSPCPQPQFPSFKKYKNYKMIYDLSMFFSPIDVSHKNVKDTVREPFHFAIQGSWLKLQKDIDEDFLLADAQHLCRQP